jgi:hypothetical protein
VNDKDIITQKDYNLLKNREYPKQQYKSVEEMLLKNLQPMILCSKVKGPTKKQWVGAGLKYFNFIEFNSKERINFIILDFDKYEQFNVSFKEAYPTPNHFKNFIGTYLDNWNIIVETTRGYQVIILLEKPFFVNNKNDMKLLKHLKKSFFETIPGIDHIASNKRWGIFRNPLKHNHIIKTLEHTNMRDFVEYFDFTKNSINISNEIYVNEYKEEILSNNIKVKDFDYYKDISREVYENGKYELIQEGGRNLIFWIIGMVHSKKIYNNEYILYNNLYSYLLQLNTKIKNQISVEEIEKIAKRCVRYTINNSNFIIFHDKITRKERNKNYYQSHKGETMTREENVKLLQEKKVENTKLKRKDYYIFYYIVIFKK